MYLWLRFIGGKEGDWEFSIYHSIASIVVIWFIFVQLMRGRRWSYGPVLILNYVM